MEYIGKNVLFMGDSITALGGWVKKYCEIMKPNVAVNLAVSGARWQDDELTVYDGNPFMDGKGEHNNRVGNQLDKLMRGKDSSHPEFKYVPEYEDFDIIIVAAGTNDGAVKGLDGNRRETIREQFTNEDGSAIPLDKVDRKTWPGIMRYTYETLKKHYPNAKIFYCTPIQAAESTRPYESIKAKRDYIIEICERISDVTVIDTFHCGICGIYETWQSNGRDLIDGLHPNKNDEAKLAACISREIKKTYI